MIDHKIRKNPVCPKCNGVNTYDINLNFPNDPAIQLSEEACSEINRFTVGNSKYYCINCSHTWKKYRGKKPYQSIQVIYADVGGYPGPNYQVKIGLLEKTVEHVTTFYARDSAHFINSITLTDIEIEWLLGELYKCDFINWAERYEEPFTLDGGYWSARIVYNTHCEIKIGSNYFPAKWSKFSTTISKLTGSDFN